MRISLSHIIVHQVEKKLEGELSIHFGKALLPHSGSLEDFLSHLHLVYTSKQGKGFAQFADDSEFAALLSAMRKGETDFLTFSEQASKKLKAALERYPFADNGVLVIAQYRALASEYLLIGLIDSRPSMKITETLELSSTDYLDIAKMDIVAQIDLSTWETNPNSNRYITYFKGRVGRKIADFFLDFMQAEVGLDPKHQNKVLLEAVEDYYTAKALEKEDKAQSRKQLFAYCQNQAKAGEELEIKALAAALPDDEAGGFEKFIEKHGVELEDSFPVDTSGLRKLTKFIGNGGGLSINFDNLLLGERVFYDEQSDTLTIKGTPPNLKDQLKRYLKAD